MALAFIQTDLYGPGGTRLRDGRDSRRSYVKRAGLIGGCEDTQAGLTAAKNFAENNLASWDPYMNLPRQWVEVYRVSGSTCFFMAVYARSGGNAPRTSLSLADVTGTNLSPQWYSFHDKYASGNYPSIAFANYDETPTHHPVAAWVYSVPCLLVNKAPLTSAVRAAMNHVNASAFSLGGVSWPANTVLAVSPRVHADEISGQQVNSVVWSWIIREDGHYYERKSASGEITGQLQYPQAAFESGGNSIFQTT